MTVGRQDIQKQNYPSICLRFKYDFNTHSSFEKKNALMAYSEYEEEYVLSNVTVLYMCDPLRNV